ncbi:MAG TPA: hypothetical protein VFQ61_35485 [Polyangiaceae bacterium]|nr:hypothetical protein [Polyangiaceae bacterium]
MNRTLILSSLLVSAACAREQTAPPAGTSVSPLSSAPAARDQENVHGKLDRMDARRPVPLLPMMANHQKENMRDHLVAVQEIVSALTSDDFAAIEQAASRIGFSEQMGRMCTHMGAGAQGFADQALNFHHTADRVAAAAREHNRGRVLSELGATLQTCTACHATWKQQVVDEATWQRVATSAPMSREVAR